MILVHPHVTPAPSRIAGLLAIAFVGGVAVGAWIGPGRSAAAPRTEIALAPPGEAAAGETAYPAELIRVVDGDTFEARVRLWPALETTTRIRLRGIDAPELRARCPAERAQAEAAAAALADLLAQGDLRVSAVSLDKYGGRVLARAATRGTPDVGAALLAAGLARPYEGRRREGWCTVASGR
ncbi:MAG: thermonuclease family protein [Variibacter sp.]|nr:thermonuclease family protein [Variibacter sp.]